MKIEVITRHNKRHVPLDKIRKVLKKCSEEMLPDSSNLSVAFLADDEMISINEQYTGRSGTTDVLSFQLGRGKFDKKWYFEILISLDRAFRQASEKGLKLTDEVIRLIVHAMVHLSGYDHHDKKSFKEMRKVEFKLLLESL